METSYDKITNRFEEHKDYTKDEVIDGLKELGLLETKKGLLGKLLGKIDKRISIETIYSNGHKEAQFILKKNNLYQLIITGRTFH